MGWVERNVNRVKKRKRGIPSGVMHENALSPMSSIKLLSIFYSFMSDSNAIEYNGMPLH